MKQTNVRWLVAVLLCSFIAVAGCKKSKNDPKPAAEIIQKTWKVKEAKEDGSKAYDASATTNKTDYSKFRLTLSATTATLVEIDGNTFMSPTWTLTGTTLTLKTPSPTPTGVTGDLTYSAVSVSDTELKMTRTLSNPKSGADKTEYVLVPL